MEVLQAPASDPLNYDGRSCVTAVAETSWWTSTSWFTSEAPAEEAQVASVPVVGGSCQSRFSSAIVALPIGVTPALSENILSKWIILYRCHPST